MTDDYSLDGPVAPPMQNGELVFEAPWQGRVFGIARGMAENGTYTWDEFRARLIEQIASFDRSAETAADAGRAAPQYRYYDHFLRALETLLVERGIVAAGELTARTLEFAARPDGHDHHHRARDHSHGHGHSDNHGHGHAHDQDHDPAGDRDHAPDDADGHEHVGARNTMTRGDA
jgi:nitrile hydratase accessory protein